MRIAMVSEHASPLAALGEVDAGGQNVHVAELSAALCRLGHEVVVYTRRDTPDLPDEVSVSGGYRVVHVPAGPATRIGKDEMLPHMGDFAAELREHWAGAPPDVVHAHFWMSGLASILATRGLKVPVVQTFHALGTVKKRYQREADTSPVERIPIERLVANRAARIAATCTDEVGELTRLGVPRDRISVVPCGVDADMFSPGGTVDPHRIVATGRLVARKGFDTIIAALAALPGVELVIAGGPPGDRLDTDPQAGRLRRHAEEWGVADRVRLVGSVSRSDMPQLLRSAAVVVCTPWYEPFGIVPLEAMACGRPVVASAVGGLIDTVVHNVTGLHVPPRSSRALAASLNQLLHDKVMNESYGMAGRDRAVARYTWSRVARDTAAAYTRVCGDRRADQLVGEGQ
ncbi:glycosyltransferase [Kibdelosporangium phytohabitans]|uniref:Glycosyl transferase n=1 Tax=Kibdelosporangium phytohabitans TaxID=860235 RepID=A0A0N9I380_9PSEU|nr:glycosyltransferase [Kibdelosporangium phytohabitans]ALG10498.1 glycosyl transferase [Kibdelosporangium phytohabitans]MBE1461588.1 glycosyltransferase involved in cell wall biosynthesis [Kibdelosporangium phytohabitans]